MKKLFLILTLVSAMVSCSTEDISPVPRQGSVDPNGKVNTLRVRCPYPMDLIQVDLYGEDGKIIRQENIEQGIQLNVALDTGSKAIVTVVKNNGAIEGYLVVLDGFGPTELLKQDFTGAFGTYIYTLNY